MAGGGGRYMLTGDPSPSIFRKIQNSITYFSALKIYFQRVSFFFLLCTGSYRIALGEFSSVFCRCIKSAVNCLSYSKLFSSVCMRCLYSVTHSNFRRGQITFLSSAMCEVLLRNTWRRLTSPILFFCRDLIPNNCKNSHWSIIIIGSWILLFFYYS